MIDVMGCGEDECHILVVADYISRIKMSFVYKVLLKYPKPSRSTPVGYRFLNYSACGFLYRCEYRIQGG